MLVPKVSNLDLGSGRKAIFRAGGGEMKGKSINYLSSLFSCDSIEDERGKGKWRLCEVVESRARAKRKLSVTESASP